MRRANFTITAERLFLLALVVLSLPSLTSGQQAESAAQLVEQFKTNTVFFRQFEVAKKLVALHDSSVLQELEPYLNDDSNRLVRGNAAFVFAGLGDDRGFDVLTAILKDKSERPLGVVLRCDGIWSPEINPTGPTPSSCSIEPGPRGRSVQDRYYAAHLFGDLKDARAVPILIPLLVDKEVAYIVPWSLGQIGDKSAIPPLIEMLDDKNPDMRVLAIYALQQLDAKEALPKIRVMLGDNEKIHFDGLIPVADAAREAIAKLEQKP
jgi:HEAT repeat protein